MGDHARAIVAKGALAAAGPPAAVRRSRRRWALAIAALVDGVQAGLFPVFIGGVTEPPEIVVDSVTAVVLLLVLGFRWRLVLGFVAELVPGLDLFPTWTALVLSLPVIAEGAETLEIPGRQHDALPQRDLPALAAKTDETP